MSSKNLLLLGSLLFLLLLTACSVFFIDRYNPLMQNDMRYEPIMEEGTQLQDSDTGRFSETIPIATETEGTAEHTGTESDVTQSQQQQHETSPQTEANLSHPAPPALRTIAPEIDLSRVPEADEMRARQQSAGEKRVHAAARSVKRKKRIAQPKRSGMKPDRSGGAILIEPVLLEKALTISPGGGLYRWDRTFLSDLADRMKRNRTLSLKVVTATPVATEKRVYMQNIRRFLIDRGVAPQRIRLIVQKRRKRSPVVITDNREESVELVLIERI